MFHSSLFLLKWFWKEVQFNSYLCFSVTEVCFPSVWVLSLYSLCFLFFSSLNRMCLNLHFWLSGFFFFFFPFLFCVLLASWICSLRIRMVRRCSDDCFIYFFCCFLPFFSINYFHCVYFTLVIIREFLDTVFFFSVCLGSSETDSSEDRPC